MNTTQHYAVIGNPIAQSRSPQIHQAFGLQTNLALSYTRLLAEDSSFANTANQFFDQGGLGLNVTAPFKLQAYELARAHLSQRATLAQAVNTLWKKEGHFYGCNTDGVGLLADLTRLQVSLQGKRVLILGAGGAVRGILEPFLSQRCAHLRISNRTPSKAQTLINDFTMHCPSETLFDASSLVDCGANWDVVINATASGLTHQAPDLPEHVYAAHSFAYDMVYQAQPTAFMTSALAQGASRVADGLGMLVEQAAESFYLWHGIRPKTAPVLDQLRQHIISEYRS